MNHRADRKAPATTPPMVTAVVGKRNTVTSSMARPAADTANIPAYSRVAPEKNRCSPGMFGRVTQRHHLLRMIAARSMSTLAAMVPGRSPLRTARSREPGCSSLS